MRAWVSWSSGKDSALALHRARLDDDLEVVGLFTTVSEDTDRVAMHAVRRELLEAQAERLGLGLYVVGIPSPCPNDEYEGRMSVALSAAADDDITCVVFGDLFLEDIRAYREQAMKSTSMSLRFPVWGSDTASLAREMLSVGVRAIVTCVDTTALPAAFVGRPFDEAFLRELPAGVDPCGENGEFHTFVWDAPGFSAPIAVEVGEIVAEDRFAFADVIASGTEVRAYGRTTSR